MQIKKNDINKIFVLFLFSHIIIWTLIPSFTNINLPLDTIEALAWSNELQLGYHKPPPLAPFLLAFYFKIFGNQDWAYYLLSQLTVAASFIIIFIFSFEFLKNRIHSLISVLLLEGIYFYNFTTPEFNPILLQLPLCAASALYCWKAINQNDNISWILFGFFSALSVLTFYLSFYLLLSLCIFFIIKIIETKKFNPKYLITLSTFFVLLLPHLIWVLNNDFISIRYGLFRSFGDPLTGLTNIKFLDHLLYPIIFLGKQFVIIIPFLIMFFFNY